MAVNYIIIVLLFLSYKITAGYINQVAGYGTEVGQYYGAQARISAWDVWMHHNSSFEVSISLTSKNDNGLAMIKTGFHVVPSLYGNNYLRFFTSSSSDAENMPPCFNMDCGDFIVANRSLFIPGQVVRPFSQYNGEDHYITMFIKKDPDTKIWTLYRELNGNSVRLGWWRNGLFGNLDDKATSIKWVGIVRYLNNDTGPIMGNGHFPEEGDKKATYMMDLKLFDPLGNSYDSPEISDLIHIVDKPECYNALPDKIDLHKFYYGGPEGCKN